MASAADDVPVHVTDSTFEGGVCSNGGALSSIGASWVVLNSLMRNNKAVGRGANPARGGTPGGGAVFFVSNDRSGSMSVESSTRRRAAEDHRLDGAVSLPATSSSTSPHTHIARLKP
ncbi:hypothetical protein SAMN04488000_1103 [Lentzea albida]|uniref:Uncharacterized protein n=1 Tax=Lentzea albida TaxID=65499 RepID=A0A1H9Q540_9PSEU|nr:hypothetical protein SAMN04488000_1103 [Lentzea albida]